MEYFLSILIILVAYLTGSIPMAYIMGRLRRGIDIRQYGSGNVGASNIFIHVGKWYIIPLGAFDIFVKGAFPVWLAHILGLNSYIEAAAGIATIAGHNWSLYLGFTGGRGIGTGLGVLLALAGPMLIAYVGVAVLGWILFRSSALWWGIATALLPFWSLGLGKEPAVTIFCGSFLLVTILKRLTSNKGTAPPGVKWREVMKQRLLYDRDIPSREEWVQRKPADSKEST